MDETPLGLAKLDREPPAADVVELGRRLFLDPGLSVDGSVACATCHAAREGFTQNGLATPVGVGGRTVRRNAPTLYNVAYRRVLFHDGRAATLERQAFSPLLTDDEMGNPSVEAVLRRVRATYDAAFRTAFTDGVTELNVAVALASFQRTILAGDSPWDRWYYGGLSEAIGEAAKRGFFLFVEHRCATCHRLDNGGAQFTDDDFHDTGVVRRQSDLGRYEVTGADADRWKFRTPTLRNVALTAPYMHDGGLTELSDVVRFYDRGADREVQDTRIRPLGLSAQDKTDLVAFLESLTSPLSFRLSGT